MNDWFQTRGIMRVDALMLLDLPDLRQTTDYDCGAAAVDTVAAYYGLRLRGPAKLANAVQGMAPDTVAAVLRSLGLSVLSGTMTVPILRDLTRHGYPVLCPVAWGGGHWLVVRGVERNRVYVQCPSRGPSSVPAATWESEWRDESHTGQAFARWGIAALKG